MIGHEMLHTVGKKRKSSKQHCFALKLDIIETAYDMLEWSFTELTLDKFNFHPHFRKLVLSCIKSCIMQIKVNHQISDTWTPTRGIRQGDPLSPYIFVLCQELLVHLIHKKAEEKLFTPVKIVSSGPHIPILCFADDCLIFSKADQKSVDTISEILEEYALASGQNVCWEKSRIIFSANTPINKKQQITEFLGVIPNKRHDKYLGLPFLMGHKKRNLFDQMINRTMNKINIWYNQYLSYAGRLVLIQAVTNVIPATACQ